MYSERRRVQDAAGNQAEMLLESGPRTLRPNSMAILELVSSFAFSELSFLPCVACSWVVCWVEMKSRSIISVDRRYLSQAMSFLCSELSNHSTNQTAYHCFFTR